jgi:hypothetical protein
MHSEQWLDAVIMTKVKSQERPLIKLVCSMIIYVQHLIKTFKSPEIWGSHRSDY